MARIAPLAMAKWRGLSKQTEGVVRIWVADQYMPAHNGIAKHHLRLMAIPKEFVPPGAIPAEAPVEDDLHRPLYSAAVAIPEGQPITRTLIMGADQADSLANLLRPGKVAVSFEVDRAHGVGGWIKPGDQIGIFTSSLKDTRLLFPSVQVLAVDEKRLEPQAPKEPPKDSDVMPDMIAPPASSVIITVLLSALESPTLMEARERGTIQVALRSRGDDLPWPVGK